MPEACKYIRRGRADGTLTRWKQKANQNLTLSHKDSEAQFILQWENGERTVMFCLHDDAHGWLVALSRNVLSQ